MNFVSSFSIVVQVFCAPDDLLCGKNSLIALPPFLDAGRLPSPLFLGTSISVDYYPDRMRFLRKEIIQNLLKQFERKEISTIYFLKGVPG